MSSQNGANSHPVSALRVARQAISVLFLERGDIIALAVYSIVIGILSLALPLAAQALFANVAFGTVLQPVLILSFIVFSLFAFSGLLQLIENIVVDRLQRRYFARLAIAFAQALTAGDRSLSSRSAGIDRANRFFEVVNIQKTISIILLDGLTLLLQMLVGLALLAVYHPLLLAFDVCLILCLGLITLLWGRRAVETAVDESKAKISVANWLHEVSGCPLTFQSTSGRALAAERADSLASAYVEKRRRHFHILFCQISGAVALQVIANASVLAIGGWLVIGGQLTLAQLVAAEIVVSSVAAGIGKLGKYLEAFYDLAAATDKVAHVLIPSTDFHPGTDSAPVNRPDTLLRFHEVKDKRAELDGASLEIGSGQFVGIHHPAPLPLRPLAELLTATRSPDRGHLELLGIDYREMARAEILERVAMINRCEVFPGSVYDNVSVHRPDATKEVVRAALESVDLLQPMLDLPAGLGTDLEEHGHFLAPGQRWRLMLARALAHKCPLIVIETIPPELTNREFRALLERLRDRLTEDGTAVLLFTDNDDVLHTCDRALELRQGRFETWEVNS